MRSCIAFEPVALSPLKLLDTKLFAAGNDMENSHPASSINRDLTVKVKLDL